MDGMINNPTLENDRSGRELLSQADLNYKAAQTYFIQKKVAMIKAIANKVTTDLHAVEEGLIHAMNGLIQNAWSKINESVLSNVKVFNGQSGSYRINSNADWTNIPDNLVERIKQQADHNGNIYSILGFYYEEWLEAELSNAVRDVAGSNINALINDFLSGFSQTGALKSNSSVRGDGLSIRPDLARGLGTTTASDGVLYDSTGKLAAELQVKFDIQNYREQNGLNTISAIENDTNILKEYLESGMFGFSVKRWVDSNYKMKQITSASGVAAEVNAEFNKSGTHSWNATYAWRTMVNIVSRYLLDILGPVNVAFITGSSFEWTSDFLMDAIFTMNIYTHKMLEDNEILNPYINSGNIYVQHYKRGRTAAMEQITMTKNYYMKGKNWNAYQLRFTISNN